MAEEEAQGGDEGEGRKLRAGREERMRDGCTSVV